MGLEEEPVAKPLDLEKVLGKAKNRIARVGVELEGAWSKLPPNILQLDHDGSVFANRRPGPEWPYIGELPIGPLLPKDLKESMTVHYPHKVNHTCGMHVHMSFETLWHYRLLMVPEYQETVVHYLSEWAKENKFRADHHIWARLRGESPFCQKKFWPDLQASTKRKDHDRNRKGHRYTIIHYCHGRQQTIECRVLPMMQKLDLAIDAVQTLLDITNACLLVLGKEKKKPKTINCKLDFPNGEVYEEYIEESL